jgi:hypothetical protein
VSRWQVTKVLANPIGRPAYVRCFLGFQDPEDRWLWMATSPEELGARVEHVP